MKNIVITGTRKGIGKALSEYYLKRGFRVIGCSRGESSIDHSNYTHFCLDVSDEKAVCSMMKSVKKNFGGVDILLNNAGIASMNHLMLTPLSSVDKIFNTNFKGTFLFLREVAKVMSLEAKENKHFRIVNFATVATPLRLEGEAIYAASKAAIVSLTQIAAREFAPFHITVNALGPTPVKTDLVKNVSHQKMEALIDRQAVKRFGEFDDVINVIDFFIDERSDFVTAQVIYLGGING